MRKSIKKTFILLLTCLMTFMCLCGFSDEHKKVVDEAKLFEYDELSTLENYAKQYGKETKLDIVIHTTKTTTNKDVELAAENLYDAMGYGYDDCDGSGAILYIDMKQRDFAVFVKGIAVAMIDNSELDDLLDSVQSQMKKGDYYSAAMMFIEMTYEYATEFLDDGEYDEAIEAWYDGEYEDGFDMYKAIGPKVPFLTVFRNPLVCLLVGAIVALIVTLILYCGSKTKNTVHSKTYVKDGSLNFPIMTERYLRTTTTTRRIQTSNSGGGGGRSPGGGGRSGSRSF